MKVTTDYSGHDASEATPRFRTQAPKGGPYLAEITKCEVTEPPERDQRIELEVRLDGGDYFDLREWLNLVKDSQRWRVDQFLIATGVLSASKRKAAWTDSQQVGKKIAVMIRHEPDNYTNPETGEEINRTRARVQAFMPKGTKTIPVPKPDNGIEVRSVDSDASEDANDEIDLVMHGAAADEENAESQAYLTGKAEAAGIDPDDYETWAELAEELQNAEGQDEADEEPEEEEAADEEPEEDDLDTLAEQAEEGDEGAQEKLYTAAEEAGIDEDTVNDTDAWAEVVEMIRNAGEEEGGDGEDEDGEEADYSSMSLTDLKAECKERELDLGAKPTKAEMIAALEEDDTTDPFES